MDYSWRFFYRPSDTWESMYKDCQAAQNSIEFEQYILENDSLGQRFLELFIEKAKQGLKVFLICDTFGSEQLIRSPLIKQLRSHGGHVHFYNRLNGWHMFTPWRWFPRTHTKTLLIDSSIAYTGGVCMMQRMSGWRDTHIRVTGPVIEQIRSAFDDIENRIMRKKSHGIIPPKPDARFQYFMNRPLKKRYAVYRELIRAIDQAERYIYIASAYFIPNHHFLKHLKRAHKRGVEIRVLVPKHSDVWLADWICLSYAPRYMRSGLRIFRYHKTVLHSKTAIIDDRWGTVGSTNFDVISFFHNREANIVITDPEAIAELKNQFNLDWQSSTELTWESWKHIPWWKKAGGTIARTVKVFFG